jgi:hypothetical protein
MKSAIVGTGLANSERAECRAERDYRGERNDRTLSIRASILMHLSDTRLFRVNKELATDSFFAESKKGPSG